MHDVFAYIVFILTEDNNPSLIPGKVRIQGPGIDAIIIIIFIQFNVPFKIISAHMRRANQ